MIQLFADEIVVDLFCGGGGATQGIEDAGLVVHECVNHDATAISTHALNHPSTNHRQSDIWHSDPKVVAAGRPVGLLWASPDCRHFSRARGAAPVSKSVRDLAWIVPEWAKAVAPRVIIVENVPEFTTWGPIRARTCSEGKRVRDVGGRCVMEPVPEKKGQTFKRWRRMLERLGYVVEWRVLDAADFGAASRRKRLYVIARRDGQPITWPEVTHGVRDERGERKAMPSRSRARSDDGRGRDGKGGARQSDVSDGDEVHQDATGTHRQRPYRTAAEIIDWSDLGTSIFDRKRPLAEKTLARIAEGIRRYVLCDPAPFTLRVTQTGEGRGFKVWPVDAPMATQTTRQDMAVVSPILATTGYGEREGQRPRVNQVADLLGTCVDGVKQAVVSPVLMNNTTHHTGGRVTSPTPTVTTGGHAGLVAPLLAVCAHGEGKDGTKRWGRGALPATDPLNAIHAGGNNFGLVAPMLGVLRNHADAMPVDGPAPTVCASGTHAALVAALMVKFYGSGGQWSKAMDPLGTCTTVDRHGLVCVVIHGVEYVIVDVLFRMLKPRELAAAMGFPSTYQWPATQREAVRLIGNAVSPPQAAALVRAVFPGGMASGRVTP